MSWLVKSNVGTYASIPTDGLAGYGRYIWADKQSEAHRFSSSEEALAWINIFHGWCGNGDNVYVVRLKHKPRVITVYEGGCTYYGSHSGRHIGERLAVELEKIGTEGEVWNRPRVRVVIEVLPK